MSSDTVNMKNTSKDGEDEKSSNVTTDSSQDADIMDTSEEVNNTKNNKAEKDEVESASLKEDAPVKEDDPLSNDKLEDEKNDKEKVKKSESVKSDSEDGDEKKSAMSNDEKSNDKSVPLLDQPLEKSGTRDRKKVQRFTEDFHSSSDKDSTKQDAAPGAGLALGDIPKIDASISRFKVDDLKILSKILFKSPGKTNTIKKSIKQFNGFEFTKDSDEYTKKLASVQKIEIKQLKSVCEMLELDKKGTKDEIAGRICEFLLDPQDSKSGSTTSGGRPKRSAAVKANNRGYSSHEEFSEDEPTSRRPQRARKGKRVNLKDESSSNESDAEKASNYSDNEVVSSEEEAPRVVVARGARKGKPPPVVKPKKQPSESEDEFEGSESEEEESDDTDEPKTKKRRNSNNKPISSRSKKTASSTKKTSSPRSSSSSTTKVSSKSKVVATKPPKASSPPARRGGRRAAATVSKAKDGSSEDEEEEEEAEVEERESSSEDEPLVKKSKTPQPPTDDEIKIYVKEILEGANLEEITMKTVCKQVYAHYPLFDLAHKKDFIKSTVKSLIST